MVDYSKPTTISEAYQNPLYQGKIVIESPDGLFSTTKEETAIKKFRQLKKKYPDNPITTTVIPKGLLMTTAVEVE